MSPSIALATDRFGRWLTAHTLHDKPLAGYLLAVVLMFVALGVRLLIAPVEVGLQYVTFFPAVTLAAVLGGLRPGLLATMLGVVFATTIFTPPYWEFGFDSLARAFWANVVFLIDGGIVSVSLDAMYRYRRQYQAELAESQQSEQHLQALMTQREADFIALQKFAAIIQSTDDAIISKSLNGIIESWNPAAEAIFGYTAEEVLGKSMTMLIPDERLSEELDILARIAGGERIAHFETVRRCKDGSLIHIFASMSPVKNGAGEIVGIAKVARDITRQKAAESQIDLFFELSVDLLCIASADGYFKRVNPAFTRTLGWRMEEILSRPYLDFVHPDDHAATQGVVDQQIMRGERVLHFENRYRHQDGSWRVLSWKSVPNDTGLMFSTARDITEDKQAETLLRDAKERAEQASRIKTSFLASMSHEIRTPLGGMLGMLELLSMSHLDTEQTATLDTACASGRGLLRIVNDILDWSKIEEGRLEITPIPTALGVMLQEVVNTYSRVASSKSLNIWQHVDTRLVNVYALDQLRLSQILNNFVSNAIKFTERGEIELRADLLEEQAAGDLIRFSVKDTGIGIDAEEQGKLFENYAQASASTARMYGGTGLGLAICRRLAEMMGGELALVSALGRGSTFSITMMLPRSDAVVEMAMPRAPDVAQRMTPVLFDNEMEAPLILVVDDHPTNRELLARQIKLLGLRTRIAENGRVGVSLWRDGRFAMVISDCHMPDMDGYEMTRSIRKIEALEGRPRTPVIAWTANALSEEQARITEAGMDELLVKPVNLAQLRAMLARWLKPDEQVVEPEMESPPEVTQSPIDFSLLDMIVADRAEQKQLLRDFMEHIRGDRTKLCCVLAQSDRAAIQSVAHRMKGSCNMVGAVAMGAICAEMEQAARQGEVAAAQGKLTALDAAIEQLDVFLG